MFTSNFIGHMLTSSIIIFPSDLCSPQITSDFLPISLEFLQICVHKKIHHIFFRFRFTSNFIRFPTNFIWFSTDLCLHHVSSVFFYFIKFSLDLYSLQISWDFLHIFVHFKFRQTFFRFHHIYDYFKFHQIFFRLMFLSIFIWFHQIFFRFLVTS